MQLAKSDQVKWTVAILSLFIAVGFFARPTFAHTYYEDVSMYWDGTSNPYMQCYEEGGTLSFVDASTNTIYCRYWHTSTNTSTTSYWVLGSEIGECYQDGGEIVDRWRLPIGLYLYKCEIVTTVTAVHLSGTHALNTNQTTLTIVVTTLTLLSCLTFSGRLAHRKRTSE